MRTFIALILLALSAAAPASELRTFDLQHRSAEELIPVIRPLVDVDGAISGSGYTLVVRSSKENLTQIASLVERLDRAPQQLLITVEQGGERQSDHSGAGISGNEAHANVRIYSTQREKIDTIGQQLRTMEGQWSSISAGKAIPQVTQQYRTGPGGTQLEQRLEYRDVDSGFEVRPRVSGDEVTLEIRPFRATPSESGGGEIEQQALSTTVRGKLGEWLEIGGHTGQQKSDERGIIYSTGKRDQLQRNIRLKVERINH